MVSQMKSMGFNENNWVSRLWEMLSSNTGDPPSSIQALAQSKMASSWVMDSGYSISLSPPQELHLSNKEILIVRTTNWATAVIC